MSSRYSVLSQDEPGSESSRDAFDLEALLRKEGNDSPRARRICANRTTVIFHWFAHASTIALLILLLLWNRKDGEHCSCDSESVSARLYAPAYEKISQTPHQRTFQNAFWQKTPYKGPPTKEIVDRWDHITATPMLNLTASEISQLGLSTDSVQYPASAGGGYIGFLESAHQLHCLQSLWEHHHFTKHPELFPQLAEKLATMPDIEERHYEHCVDVIRQRLECTADASIVTFRWVQGLSSPYPNFKTDHMCMDYDALLGWAKGREADDGLLEGWDWKPGAGDVVMDHLP